MKRAYRDLALARLRVHTFTASDVVDTQILGSYQDRPSQYIVLYTSNEPAEINRLTGPSVDHDVRFITRCVGKTVDDAMAAADHVAAQFLNWRPDVPGRKSRVMRHVSSDPIRLDSSIGDGLFFYEDEWSLVTKPR